MHIRCRPGDRPRATGRHAGDEPCAHFMMLPSIPARRRIRAPPAVRLAAGRTVDVQGHSFRAQQQGKLILKRLARRHGWLADSDTSGRPASANVPCRSPQKRRPWARTGLLRTRSAKSRRLKTRKPVAFPYAYRARIARDVGTLCLRDRRGWDRNITRSHFIIFPGDLGTQGNTRD